MQNKTTIHILFLIFFISVSLRYFLCTSGGQFFYVDEARFMNGHYLLAHISDGDWTSAIKRITTTYAHTFFIFISAILEGFRYLFVLAFIDSSAPAFLLADSRIAIEVAAYLLSFASSTNIILLYLVVKSSGGTNLQGVIASVMLAASTTNFYFSRHLLPYDISISFALIALIFALKKRNYNLNNVLCGLFCGLTTLTYNGYWTLSALVWLILLYKSKGHLVEKIKCGVISLSTGILPIILLYFISLNYEGNFLEGMQEWLAATKKNQYGDFGIGWKVLIYYLWDSERVVSILYFLSIFTAITFFIKKNRLELNSKDIGFFSILFLIIILICLCDILNNSVLYGRTIKQTIPFFCLAISYPIACLTENFKSRILIFSSILIFGIQVIYNFKTCLEIEFPNNFILKSSSHKEEFSQFAEISGPNISKLESSSSNHDHAIINAQSLIPPFTGYKNIPIKKIYFESDHPYNFKPYQYIHYRIKERTTLQEIDLKMKFVELDI